MLTVIALIGLYQFALYKISMKNAAGVAGNLKLRFMFYCTARRFLGKSGYACTSGSYPL